MSPLAPMKQHRCFFCDARLFDGDVPPNSGAFVKIRCWRCSHSNHFPREPRQKEGLQKADARA